ncbi:MAG TPA: helix-turn-helix transcriptional regulator [Candidatus Sumerlaeota bacterium]|nr:helix-turn-helix transcriptional regulator [Candidatus Sumerlaeota bacterium]
MYNALGELLYENRCIQGLTQDQFGAKYHVTGPAIFKFEKGYVKPSLDLWLKMAKDFQVHETRAVLMWVKSRLPEEYQDLIQIQDSPLVLEDETGAKGRKRRDYAKISDREEIRRQISKDPKLPKELKHFLRMDEIWSIYKPTGREINLLRDRFSDLGKGSDDAFREALRAIRMFTLKK